MPSVSFELVAVVGVVGAEQAAVAAGELLPATDEVGVVAPVAAQAGRAQVVGHLAELGLVGVELRAVLGIQVLAVLVGRRAGVCVSRDDEKTVHDVLPLTK